MIKDKTDAPQSEQRTRLRVDVENAVLAIFKISENLVPSDRVSYLDFRGAWMQNINLRAHDLRGAIFDGANLSHSFLNSCRADEVSFAGANLTSTNLMDVSMESSDLSGAQLQGANLSGAQLQRANLILTQLQGANLNSAELQRADLRGAFLQSVTFGGTQLQGAKLGWALLQGAYLSAAQFDSSTSFTSTNFRGAGVNNVDFTQTYILTEQLEEMFGDATVTLPGGHGPDHENWPEHWSKEELDWPDFYPQWRDYQQSIGQDPDNPT